MTAFVAAPGSTIAIVPVKRLAEAKQRLSRVLSPDQRRQLVLTMLGDVLGALRQSPGISGILVVSRDSDVANLARSHGARIGIEPDAADLNAAIAYGLDLAHRAGATRAVIVPGDVPLATPADFAAVLAAASSRETAVLAPASDGDGSNALLLPLPAPFALAYGPASAQRHQAIARKAGIRMAIVNSDGLGRDIDTPGDLEVLAHAAGYGFLPADSMACPPQPRLSETEALALVEHMDLAALMARAEAMTVAAHGTVVSNLYFANTSMFIVSSVRGSGSGSPLVCTRRSGPSG